MDDVFGNPPDDVRDVEIGLAVGGIAFAVIGLVVLVRRLQIRRRVLRGTAEVTSAVLGYSGGEMSTAGWTLDVVIPTATGVLRRRISTGHAFAPRGGYAVGQRHPVEYDPTGAWVRLAGPGREPVWLLPVASWSSARSSPSPRPSCCAEPGRRHAGC